MVSQLLIFLLCLSTVTMIMLFIRCARLREKLSVFYKKVKAEEELKKKEEKALQKEAEELNKGFE